MAKFFRSVTFKFGGNIVVSRALYRLAVDGVRDNGLVLARQILIEQFDHSLPANLKIFAHIFSYSLKSFENTQVRGCSNR